MPLLSVRTATLALAAHLRAFLGAELAVLVLVELVEFSASFGAFGGFGAVDRAILVGVELHACLSAGRCRRRGLRERRGGGQSTATATARIFICFMWIPWLNRQRPGLPT
jgi:hypothetical protein